ncbi:MAG TPA: alpha-amylase family glycosyl hydrolase [Anaerolineae bacterium]|nr:alpha-amylase family glycosyl hydrolase [Anaerolineae bacterium]HNU04355.1 alpha-amylase family glycosyl hydrolase [Anaerolineae bacterium]
MAALWSSLDALLAGFRAQMARAGSWAPRTLPGLSQEDAILITYGDQISEPGGATPPLRTLARFLDAELAGSISGVHILPCFPYSSDDGFSVIDYTQIDPALGDWADVARLGARYRLMFDFVANHISQHSAWFQAYRRGEAPYHGFFIEVDPAVDLSQVVRPRALPLLTAVETTRGPRHVWTTFSADQIDLDYANPAVLLTMTGVLLHYVAHGAEIIRLDAVAYLWKQVGASCIHLPQAHAVIKLWRAVLDAVAPHVLLITETNVPHADNISYFGQTLPETRATDEAQLVYNFSLAPLTLHALLTGDAGKLSAWAATLQAPAGGSFFNFIASHDGIGVLPARDILSDGELHTLVERTLAHGGQVSVRSLPDGSHTPYELNITLYDFLNRPGRAELATDIARFLASQAILLALAGVPGIYVHSLFGSPNCHDCFAETGRARSLNRKKWTLAELRRLLAEPHGQARRVFDGYRRLLHLRRAQPAFHPASSQQVLYGDPALFTLLRGAELERPLLCSVNVSDRPATLRLDAASLPGRAWRDLLSGEEFVAAGAYLTAPMDLYQIRWLTVA